MVCMKAQHLCTACAGVAPEVQLEAVVAQGFQLLVVLVVADADDGQLGALQRLYEVGHTAPVTRRHAVYLIHDQAHLHHSTG